MDLNNNRLLNVPAPVSDTDIVRKMDIEEIASPDLSSKQDVLVSGVNIKTINNESVLGSGNLVITGSGGSSDHNILTNRTIPDQHPISAITGLQPAIDGKAPVVHTHVIADVTNLQTTLDNKASTSVATTSANGLMSSTDKVKLDGVAIGATANSSDATLLNRSNHTGAQAISTVTGLQTSLDGKQPLDGDLTAIAALSTNGVPKRTGTDTWSILADVKEIVVSTTAPGDTTKLWLDIS